jgi:hypothetical protein
MEDQALCQSQEYSPFFELKLMVKGQSGGIRTIWKFVCGWCVNVVDQGRGGSKSNGRPLYEARIGVGRVAQTEVLKERGGSSIGDGKQRKNRNFPQVQVKGHGSLLKKNWVRADANNGRFSGISDKYSTQGKEKTSGHIFYFCLSVGLLFDREFYFCRKKISRVIHWHFIQLAGRRFCGNIHVYCL